jgi:hypothetical protein
VNVAISDDAANTTTVPEMLGAIGPAELAGAALLEGAGAADDVPALGVADDTSAVADVEDADAAAFFDELHPARPSATTTAVTMPADAFRFMNSPRRVKGRRLIGVRY